MSHRRSFAVLLALVVVAGPGPAARAADQAGRRSPAPLLWEGRVVDRHGQPGPAMVTAFIRPPTSAIPDAGEPAPAPASIPVASAQAGGD
ncbi:MAG: hypothetical protein ACRDZ7_18655, partial [Acidimicrobiia bacterium]